MSRVFRLLPRLPNPKPPKPCYPLWGYRVFGKDFGCGAKSLARTRICFSDNLFFIMPGIDKRIIDRVLEAAKIEEVISDFDKIGLKKKGVRYLGYCPFHDDRHVGSFVVYPKKQCFKCFSCGAKGGVIEFLKMHEHLSFPDAIRYLGKKYSIETDMNDFNYTPPPPRPAPPPLELLVLPKHLMAGTITTEAIEGDNLIKWIRTGIAWDTVQRKRVEEMIGLYNLGHGKNGHTIFWQIDEKGRLHTGKMMKYKPDGHRDKQAKWNFDFIHSTLSKHWNPERREMTDEPPYPFPHLYNPSKQEAQVTFFGLHLLDHWKRKDIEQTVCIVESEKTALLMSIAYGNNAKQVWIACGGLEMLTRERLKPLTNQHRRIILYPDRDGIEKWRIKAEQLHYDRRTLDTRPVTDWWQPQDGEKADIADVVIRMINESKPMTTIEEVAEAMPEAKELIDKLNLTIEK